MSLNNDVSEVVRHATHTPWVAENLWLLYRHDVDTYRHSCRVGIRSVELGILDGVEKQTYALLAVCGLLHDIGKTSVPSKYLNKNGPLTPDEQEVMDRHPLRGFMLLKSDHRVPPEVLRSVVSHHTWQRRRYPDNVPALAGISREIAQIVALADSYDALTSERAYKKALPHEKAIDILRAQYTGEPRLLERAERLEPLVKMH
ncbi:MAG: HD domain-containing protein [Candidatus Woesearchaeota archaeon]|nr:HD domain-containing protein [Candidatus Woesearchaeota archaeon]